MFKHIFFILLFFFNNNNFYLKEKCKIEHFTFSSVFELNLHYGTMKSSYLKEKQIYHYWHNNVSLIEMFVFSNDFFHVDFQFEIWKSSAAIRHKRLLFLAELIE